MEAERQILSLEDLEWARIDRRAVYAPADYHWNAPMPAAFIMNLSGTIILRLIQIGLFTFNKPATSKRYGKH